MLDAKTTNDLLNKVVLIAKDDRARLPYSKDEGFVPKIMFIGPNDESLISAITWKDEQEKYVKMRAASDAAKQLCAQAIVLISDTRWLQSDKFNEHFKIEGPTYPVTDQSFKEYQDRYYAILRQHGGEIKKLPRHLWNEAVMVAIKGPRCGTHSILAPYIQGPGDKVQYLTRDQSKFAGEKNPDDWQERMNLIPEWWQ